MSILQFSKRHTAPFRVKLQACLITLGCLSGFPVNALEPVLPLSQTHFTNLGITLGTLKTVTQIPVLYAPAKVIIPPNHDYIVSTSQAGLITKLEAAVGDQVTRGQVLAVINSPEFLALQSQYLNAKNTLNLAAITYARDKKLLAEGIVADRRAQETGSQYSSALFHVNEAKQLLEIAGMSASAIEQLSRTQKLNSQLTIHAPVSGTILERMAFAGRRIDNLAPLYRIGILDELWLEINIPQEHLVNIKPGYKVLIENTAIEAELSVLGKSVNPENQTVIARAIIKGTQTLIRPGQKLNTQIMQVSEQMVFKVPNTAIAQNESQAFIFIRQPTGFLVSPVKIVGKQGDESIIAGDFKGTEEIAITGAVALKANWLGLGSE